MHSNRADHSNIVGLWQGPSGCQQMQWRTERGGYLREILTARVYDVAVRPCAFYNTFIACYSEV